MNENVRTGIFAGVAVVALGVTSLAVVPFSSSARRGDIVDFGELFFEEFEPQEAASFEIVELDDTSGEFRQFKVGVADGKWVIPSHSNYPADAKDQMESAAASIVNLRKGQVATDSMAMHEELGVLDPDAQKAASGQKGFGKRVTFTDAKDNKLAQFILGKVTDPSQPRNRFVRVPGQDRVYRVEVDTSKLSTRFEDWIEKDLLQLNAFDIRNVLIMDYKLDVGENNIPVDQIELNYDDKSSKWSLAGDKENQELDSSKLTDMKNALDSLKIVDVHRKPAWLAAFLRGEKLPAGLNQAEVEVGRDGMQRRGFYITPGQLISNDGQVVVQTSEGLNYTLSFGAIAGEGGEAATAAVEGEEKPPTTGANRFIMVNVSFNEDLVARPEGLDLPAKPAEGEMPAEGEDGERPAEEGEKAAGEGDAPAGGDAEPAAQDGPKEGQAEGDPPLPGSDVEDEAAAGEAEAPADGEKKSADETDEDGPKTAAEREAERERKRKLAEYEEKVKKGKEKAERLAARFSDWYYVIADSEYKRIHLNRDQIVKKPLDASGLGDADKLDKLPQDEGADDDGTGDKDKDDASGEGEDQGQ